MSVSPTETHIWENENDFEVEHDRYHAETFSIYIIDDNRSRRDDQVILTMQVLGGNQDGDTAESTVENAYEVQDIINSGGDVAGELYEFFE